MKIHRLLIRNITSMRGTFEIDFEQNLTDEDLFAITGPTGSGKSSILSSISLALFGRNYKSTLNQADFVSLGEKDARIELLFSTNNQTYQAVWECRVRNKRDGSLLKTPSINHHFFANGEALQTNAEEILHLNFDQFCKTVILNQGEFATFISSSFSERKSILERLYAGEQLTNISKNLRIKVKELDQLCSNQQEIIKNSLPYTKEEIEESKQLVKALRPQKEQNSIFLAELTSFERKLADILDLSTKKNELQDKIVAYEENIRIATKEYNQAKEKLTAAQEKIKLQETELKDQSPKLTQAIKLKNEIELSKQHLLESDKQVIEIEKHIQNCTEKAGTLQRELASLEKNKTTLLENSPLSELLEEQVQQIKRHIAQAKELHHQNDISTQGREYYKKQLAKIETQLTSEQSEAEQLKKSLQLIALDKTKQQKKELSLQIETLNRTWDKLQSLKAEAGAINSLIEKNSSAINTDQHQLNSLKKDLELTNKDIALFEMEKLASATALCLKESQKQGTCVVCNTKLEKELQILSESNDQSSQLEKLEKLQAKRMDEEKLIAITQERISLNQKELDNNRQKKHTFDKEIESHKLQQFDQQKEQLELDMAKCEEQISSHIAQTEKLATLIKNIASNQQEFAKLTELTTQTEKQISDCSEKMKSTIQEIRSLSPNYSQELEEVASQFDEDLNTLSKLNKIEMEIGSTAKQIQINQESLKTSSDQLKKLQLNHQTKENEIKAKKQEQLTLCPEGDPEQILTKLEQALKNFNSEKDKLLQLTHTKELNKDKTASTLSSLIDRQKEIDLTILEEFSKAQKIGSVLTDLSIEIENNQTAQDLAERFDHALTKLIQMEDSFHISERKTELAQIHDDITRPFMEEFSLHCKTIEELLTNHKIRIDVYNKKEKEQNEAMQALLKHKEKLERLQTLQQVLGKDEFRNFALGLIESQLIEQANHELDGLCDGRYKLIQIEKKQGHDFYIIDRWNGGLQRKISTLSGGETFLISLSMALALSEMTRGRTEIDSFFIDEGFGSLDHDCIDDVLETLFNIRNRGKQIGIISHIKPLTSRIPINIELEKSQFGETSLQFRYN